MRSCSPPMRRYRRLMRNCGLAAVLTSLRGAVTVVDPDLQVVIWSRKAEELWGLRVDETVGRHLLNLDFGLPVDQLSRPIRHALSGQNHPEELVLDATNRRGRPIQCRVTLTPLMNASGETEGAILLQEEVESSET